MVIYETGAEERAIILRWFISAKYGWNYTWRLGISLTFSKIAGITVQTGMTHPSCMFLLLSGHRASLEHLKDNKEIVWNYQVLSRCGTWSWNTAALWMWNWIIKQGFWLTDRIWWSPRLGSLHMVNKTLSYKKALAVCGTEQQEGMKAAFIRGSSSPLGQWGVPAVQGPGQGLLSPPSRGFAGLLLPQRKLYTGSAWLARSCDRERRM